MFCSYSRRRVCLMTSFIDDPYNHADKKSKKVAHRPKSIMDHSQYIRFMEAWWRNFILQYLNSIWPSTLFHHYASGTLQTRQSVWNLTKVFAWILLLLHKHRKCGQLKKFENDAVVFFWWHTVDGVAWKWSLFLMWLALPFVFFSPVKTTECN